MSYLRRPPPMEFQGEPSWTSKASSHKACKGGKTEQDRFTNVQLFRRRRRGEAENQIARSLRRGYLALEDLQEKADHGTAAVLRDISEVLKDMESFVVNKDLEGRFMAISEEMKDAAMKVRKRARGVRLSVKKERVKGLGADALQALNQLRRLAVAAAVSQAFRRFVLRVIVLARDTFLPRHALGAAGIEEALEGGGPANILKGKVTETEGRDQTASTRDEKGEFGPERTIARRWLGLMRELNADANLRRTLQDAGAILRMLAERYTPGERLGGTKYVSSKMLSDVQSNLDAVLQEIRRLLEALAHQDMEPILEASHDLLDAITKDSELAEWVANVKGLVRDSGREEAFDEESLSRRLKEVIDKGRSLSKGRHKELVTRAITAYYDFGAGISRDIDFRTLSESAQFVLQDLFFDKEGYIVAKPDLYISLFKQLRPALQAALSGFRIERVEHQDENIYFVVEDIAFHGLKAMPSELRITNMTDVAIGETLADSEIFSGIRLTGKGYNVDIRNLMFHYELRQFPRLRDRGLMDIALQGDGLSFDIELLLDTDLSRILRSVTEQRCTICGRPMDEETHETKSEKRWSAMSGKSRKRRSSMIHKPMIPFPTSGAWPDGRMFRVNKVDVKLHGLQLRFRHAHHTLLYKLLQPFMTSRIEKEIERTMEEKIYNIYDKAGVIFHLAQQYAFQGSTAFTTKRILRGTDVNVGHVDYVPENEWPSSAPSADFRRSQGTSSFAQGALA